MTVTVSIIAGGLKIDTEAANIICFFIDRGVDFVVIVLPEFIQVTYETYNKKKNPNIKMPFCNKGSSITISETPSTDDRIKNVSHIAAVMTLGNAPANDLFTAP